MDLSKINKKLITYIGGAIGAVILIFVILFMVKLCSGGKLSYEKIEEKMVAASKKYYSEENHKLPLVDEKSTVTADVLSDGKYMKPLSKVTKKDISCTGEVVVTYNGKEYNYMPYLDCGKDYKTTKLYEELIKDENLVTEGSGLYYLNNKYIYRGEYVNNYIKFNGSLWRIISIDNDGKVEILQEENSQKSKWDDRYNINRKNSTGITEYDVSRIHETLISNLNSFNKEDLGRLSIQSLCIGGRTEQQTGKDGSLECLKKLDGEYFGLLRADEFLQASIDINCNKVEDMSCKNYNYLSDSQKAFWLLTPDSSVTHLAYKLSAGQINRSTANTDGYVRMTAVLHSNVLYKSGNGTKEKPYLIK